MALTYSRKGIYNGYETTVIIRNSKGKLRISTKDNATVGYEINSDNSTTPASNTVTLMNISKSHLAKIHENDHIEVYTGPKDLFGLISEGYITAAVKDQPSGRDRETTLTFTEAVKTKNAKIYSNFNGAKTVKKSVKVGGKTISYTKRVAKKVNITFVKGTKSSTIIRRICRDAGLPIGLLELKKDYVWKKGYTVSQKPLTALASISKRCDTKMYQQRGKLVFESWEKPNPFNNHIFLSPATGLISDLTYSSDDGGTYTGTCFEHPLVMAGVATQVKSPGSGVNRLMRVKQVTHTHDTSSYTMEVVWSA